MPATTKRVIASHEVAKQSMRLVPEQLPLAAAVMDLGDIWIWGTHNLIS